jgi:hypothetical protein
MCSWIAAKGDDMVHIRASPSHIDQFVSANRRVCEREGVRNPYGMMHQMRSGSTDSRRCAWTSPQAAGRLCTQRPAGPASALAGGGIERPVGAAFSADGRSLYVSDFGVARVETATMMVFAHTGMLWRVTAE